jgi:hypothetical protein
MRQCSVLHGSSISCTNDGEEEPVTDTNAQEEFTPTGPQSRAFREATDADHWDDDINALVQLEGAVHHEPITDISRIQLPEYYQAQEWDKDRDDPKNVTEARDALAVRIDDPSAPDTNAEASAYDDLKD